MQGSSFYSIIKMGLFLDNFLPGSANALFADLADVLVACFIGFTLFVTFLRPLYHDEFTVAAVLGVELHHGMGGCGRSGEEV